MRAEGAKLLETGGVQGLEKDPAGVGRLEAAWPATSHDLETTTVGCRSLSLPWRVPAPAAGSEGIFAALPLTARETLGKSLPPVRGGLLNRGKLQLEMRCERAHVTNAIATCHGSTLPQETEQLYHCLQSLSKTEHLFKRRVIVNGAGLGSSLWSEG